MRRFVVLSGIALVLILGTAVAAEVRHSKPTMARNAETAAWEDFGDWRLRPRTPATLDAEILRWANGHYADAIVSTDARDAALQAVPPFTMVEKLSFAVVSVPANRRYVREDVLSPTSHIIYVLKDVRGDRYEATVQTLDAAKSNFAVVSIGPLLDLSHARRALPVNARRMSSWSETLDVRDRVVSRARHATTSTQSSKPRLVFVPYPTGAGETFRQFGADPATAIFESLGTGDRFSGLSALLDDIDRALDSAQ